jgi:3-oxoadipate enol-lactonase
MDLDTRTLPLAGTSLAYHVARPDAAGVPVVLLHPWFGCWQFWIATMRHLAERPCYAVDLYSPAGGDWTSTAGPEELGGAVLEMLTAEGLEQVDVVGNSVGGIVAQVVAVTAPHRVRRLVLVGTGANTRGALPGFGAAVDRWIASARERGPATRDAVEATVDLLFTGRPGAATWESYVQAVLGIDPAYLAAVLGAARRLDLVPRLGDITAPALVIRGTEDTARGAQHSAALAAGISTVRSIEMPGAGHSPMVDHPAEFARLVRAHLDEPVPARPVA